MKKLLVAFSFLMIAVFSCQASAANFNLGLINPSQTFGNNVQGAFSDNYSFTVPTNNGTAASVTNAFKLSSSTKITNFQAWVDGNLLALTNTATQQLLEGIFAGLAASIVHTLTISGTAANTGASYGGSIAVDVVATPIPAAVWLFGSALIGLTGVKRRKA